MDPRSPDSNELLWTKLALAAGVLALVLAFSLSRRRESEHAPPRSIPAKSEIAIPATGE